MYKLTFALLVILAACNFGPSTHTTPSGVRYKIISTNKDGLGAPMIATVKAIPNTKTDSSHSHLPIYKLVVPPAPYISDPLAEVLITGVREGDSLVITDTSGKEISYKIEKVFIPAYKGMNTDSLIKADNRKEVLLMQKEQLGYGAARVERFIKTNNPHAIKNGDVYVEILNKGTAPFADSGRRVGIRFSSRNLHTGEVVNSNIDKKFHLPPVYEYVISTGKMYQPVDDVMHQLGKGGKARIYIPAIIALGEKANDPRIDLTQDIVFDIEVVSIK